MRVNCLDQEHNVIGKGLEPGVECTNHVAITPAWLTINKGGRLIGSFDIEKSENC